MQEIKELQESGRQKVSSRQEQVNQLMSEEEAVERELQAESKELQAQITTHHDLISTVRLDLHSNINTMNANIAFLTFIFCPLFVLRRIRKHMKRVRLNS